MKIGSYRNETAVKEQYASSGNLNTRLSFHDKYSTNRQGYGNWIVSHCDFRDGMRVLEVGCGTGRMWAEHGELIARCARLVLTDLSDGMLAAARETLGERENVTYLRADVQRLPFPDGSFDAVIANAMLYHVPDLKQGIGEVRRVLKNGGCFYCATYGEHNFTDRLAEWFRLSGESYRPNHSFTMENGARQLACAFREVTALFYEDSFRITSAGDLADYLYSLVSLRAVGELPREKLLAILKCHAENGVIELPKEYGMFLCR